MVGQPGDHRLSTVVTGIGTRREHQVPNSPATASSKVARP